MRSVILNTYSALFAFVSAMTVAGQATPPNIEVLPDGKQCILEFPKTQMPCNSLPDYLHNTLRLDAQRQVCVILFGAETIDARALMVAELLNSAGFPRAGVCLSKRCKDDEGCSLADHTMRILVNDGGITCIPTQRSLVPCDKIVDYLINTLNVSKRDYVGIDTQGCTAAVVARAHAIANALRKAGFTLVRENGFTAPDMTCIP